MTDLWDLIENEQILNQKGQLIISKRCFRHLFATQDASFQEKISFLSEPNSKILKKFCLKFVQIPNDFHYHFHVFNCV